MERDTYVYMLYYRYSNFNSHAHVERDLMLLCPIRLDNNFNSHAHVERDLQYTIYCMIVFYFNSHAHVERDGFFCTDQGYVYISTHTLTWSVTKIHSNGYQV